MYSEYCSVSVLVSKSLTGGANNVRFTPLSEQVKGIVAHVAGSVRVDV
jgi:hypothetical protein